MGSTMLSLMHDFYLSVEYQSLESRAFVVWVALIINESGAPFLILMHRGHSKAQEELKMCQAVTGNKTAHNPATMTPSSHFW